MPEAAQGQAAQEAEPQNQDNQPAEDDNDPTTWKPERAAQTIAAQRRAEQEARKAAAAWEKRAKELENAGKSEAEKTAQRLADLEKQLNEERQTRRSLTTRSAITTAASKAGAVYPDAIARLVDPSELDLEEDGTPRNLSTVLKGLRETYPELFKSTRGSADGGPRGKAGAPGDMNSLIRQSLGR